MRFSLFRGLLAGGAWGILLLGAGCTQHDDITQPMTQAVVVLHPDRLPALDTLYCYELWMAAVSDRGGGVTAPGTAYRSLGKFQWDPGVARFRDLDGRCRDNRFDIPGFWFDYDYIVVTVENLPDPYLDEPSGCVMLVAGVADPVWHTMTMEFPVSFAGANGFYFVGSPTDDTSFYNAELDTVWRYSVNEEKGLWLGTRSYTRWLVQDTLGIIPRADGEDSVYVDVSVDNSDDESRYIPDIIGIVHPPGGWPSAVEYDTIVFGYDSVFDHRRIEFIYIDTVDTNFNYVLRAAYDTLQSQRHFYYYYQPSLASLPDVSPFGWRYNCWIFLEQPDPSVTEANTGMNLSPMSPPAGEWQNRYFGRPGWGVLPLGAFIDPTAPDRSNRYIGNREVPDFPGEDFVVGARPRFDHLDLRREAARQWGCVVVGLEPDPAVLRIDTTANFPLFVMSDFLRSASDPTVAAGHDLHNWSQFLPAIGIAVEFHE